MISAGSGVSAMQPLIAPRIDFARAMRATNFYTFDDAVTAPLRAIETALRPFVGKRVPPGDVDDVKSVRDPGRHGGGRARDVALGESALLDGLDTAAAAALALRPAGLDNEMPELPGTHVRATMQSAADPQRPTHAAIEQGIQGVGHLVAPLPRRQLKGRVDGQIHDRMPPQPVRQRVQ